MPLVDDYRDVSFHRSSLVCLGNFDGLHRGHRLTMQRAVKRAKEKNLDSVLFTFSPHPRKVIPSRRGAPALLFTEAEKKELLSKLPFDWVVFQNFDEAFSKISHESFAKEVLKEGLRAREIVVGKNFRYGHLAKGDAHTLEEIADLHVDVAEFVRQTDESVVSSSAIRTLITEGKVELANSSLGYPYFLSGVIVRGDERGKKLGFPTANLKTEKECLPEWSVYFTILEDQQTKDCFASITNIGQRPTFDKKEIAIETHLLRFEDDLYDREMRLYILKRHREEKRFSSGESLRAQIDADVQACQDFFETTKFLQKNFFEDGAVYQLSKPSIEGFQPLEMISNIFSDTKI